MNLELLNPVIRSVSLYENREIKLAHNTVVIENGTVVAFDNHDNLMKTSDTYRDIYASQMRTSEGGEANG